MTPSKTAFLKNDMKKVCTFLDYLTGIFFDVIKIKVTKHSLSTAPSLFTNVKSTYEGTLSEVRMIEKVA